MQVLQTKAEGCLAGRVVRTNLPIGLMDQHLFALREAIESLEVPFFIDKPHSPLLHAALEDVISGSFICHDVSRSDRQRALDESLIRFRRDPSLDIDGLKHNDPVEIGDVEVVTPGLEADPVDDLFWDGQLITTSELGEHGILLVAVHLKDTMNCRKCQKRFSFFSDDIPHDRSDG